MNPNINKPMFSDRYGKDIRNPESATSKDTKIPGSVLDNSTPFQSPYDAPGVAIEGEQNSGLNEHNYFGKSRMNKNNFKEYVDENPQKSNRTMAVVITISILLLVTIGISIIALLI
jgi:hypothetical protein